MPPWMKLLYLHYLKLVTLCAYIDGKWVLKSPPLMVFDIDDVHNAYAVRESGNESHISDAIKFIKQYGV